MPQGPQKVIVLDPDVRAGRMLQLGFEREGIAAVVSQDPAKIEVGPGTGIALVGGSDGRAIELVRRTREVLVAANTDLPIVATSRATRAELEAAGADEVVAGPAFIRDMVTIARVLNGAQPGRRDHCIGSLVETTGVYTLVRALSALGRSAVLTLIRGLRRGEVRFHHGEVTSAQVGLIHGQAAFHQLLLWTDARFDFSHEDVVRRQQIPLAPDELFADAERFLDGVRASAEKLSPSMVLEQNVQRVQSLGSRVPTEVHGVLRMFDGHRVLADVLEDAPFRVFETLRVAQKAMEAGLLQPVEAARPKATWRAVLALEEWLVGSETREAVIERTSKLDTGPVRTGDTKKTRKRRKKRRASSPAVDTVPDADVEIDWSALVPRGIGAEVPSLAGVVPALDTHGEIDVASRGAPREGLEALMDTGKRDRIFPSDIGIEPSVVLGGDTDEWERIEWEAKSKVKAEAEAAKAKADAEAADAKASADAAKTKADADAAKAKADAEARAKSAAEVRARLEADIKAKAAADAKAKDAEAQRFREEAQARVRESVERMRVERILREQADARATAIREDPSDRAAAQMIATPVTTEPAPSGSTDAKALVQALVADVVRPPERASHREVSAEPVTIAETPTATVTVAETMTVVGVADTVTLTSTATIVVREPMMGRPPAAPAPTEDEPSDGIVRSMVATIDSERERARKRPPTSPPHAPILKDTTGEIRPSAPVVQVAPLAEPSVLVDDLAAAHSAIAAVIAAPAPATLANAASSSRELAIAEVRRDAVAFTEQEEAFFKNADASQPHVAVAPPRVESFDDLDEGYQPPKFWDRVFGRNRGSSPAIRVPPDKKR